MKIPFDDETRVDRDETRVDRERGPGGRRMFAAVDGHLATYPFPAESELTLGRSPALDLNIDHPSVSRRHSLLRIGEELSIEDLGSSNGTWVRGRRLEPGAPVPFQLGEVVRLGDVSVWIEQRPGDARRRKPSSRGPVSEVPEAPVVVDEAMKALYALVDRVAPGAINVLLLGETGVGKEVVARAIHYRSERGSKPFVALNCAAFSEELLESELFGHERGAFTGAGKAKPGLLETARGGTVLLDEVGELALSSQAKLLRALEEQKVLRLGSLKPREIDVRFVCATNRDLTAEVEAGRFRRDLYYRLNGVTLNIPPLRDRKAEIEPLARRYVRVYSSRLGRQVPELLPDAQQALVGHSWPGNIRELRNTIQRAVLLCADEPIGAAHLGLDPGASLPVDVLGAAVVVEPPTDIAPPRRSERPTDRLSQTDPPAESGAAVAGADLRDEMDRLERRRILEALDRCGGNQTRAAKELGISRNTLIRKLDRYGVPRPRKKR